jgi:hypothetical protein
VESAAAPIAAPRFHTASTEAPILYSVHLGDEVSIMGRTGDWLRLRTLRPEWCYAPLVNMVQKENTIEEMVALLWEAHPELHK